jgi:hypothetical protein
MGSGQPTVERGSYVAQIDKNTTTPYDVAASTLFTVPECVGPRGCCFLRAAASFRLGIS